ncbi:MAG: glycosyltransferase [Bacteroidota bacterium]
MSTTCICILNYNNGQKTINCLASVLKQTVENYRIIIIDNNSDDGSSLIIDEFAEQHKMQLRYIKTTELPTTLFKTSSEIVFLRASRNGGYSFGNNWGIRAAQSCGLFTHVLIINNDVVLKPSFLEEMLKQYQLLANRFDTELIALGATEMGGSGGVHHHGFHYIHLLTGITVFKPCFPSFKYIVGACIFLPIHAPLMDESFFLYFDDVQYTKILLRNNFLIQNYPDAVFVHDVGGTPKRNTQLLIYKSLLRFYRLNYPWLLPVVVPVRWLLLAYLWVKGRLVR